MVKKGICVILVLMLLTGCMKSIRSNDMGTHKSVFTPLLTTKPPEQKNFLQIGFDLMANETIESLRIKLSEKDTERLIGRPEEKSEIQLWGADGKGHQTWYYKSKGLELCMVKDHEEKSIYSIFIQEPSHFKTSRGIGIYSTYEETLAQYSNEINDQDIGNQFDELIAGTEYGGITFKFQNNRITSIFIGASAE